MRPIATFQMDLGRLLDHATEVLAATYSIGIVLLAIATIIVALNRWAW